MKFIQRTTLLFLMLLTTGVCQTSSHDEWVENSLVSIEAIREGMTRAELERVFSKEGGLSSRTHRTYAYRDCHYFKVDVVFEPAPGSNSENPEDKIASISRPYLSRPTAD